MHSSCQIWPINGLDLIGESQSAVAINRYRRRPYKTCNGDRWSQLGLSIKHIDRRRMLHHRTAIGDYKSTYNGPGLSRYAIAINCIVISQLGLHRGARYIQIYMCDPMNRTRWLYKYYCIRFEICRKGIFNVFCIFHLLNEIPRMKHRCNKTDPKGFLKAIICYFRSDISHFTLISMFLMYF